MKEYRVWHYASHCHTLKRGKGSLLDSASTNKRMAEGLFLPAFVEFDRLALYDHFNMAEVRHITDMVSHCGKPSLFGSCLPGSQCSTSQTKAHGSRLYSSLSLHIMCLNVLSSVQSFICSTKSPYKLMFLFQDLGIRFITPRLIIIIINHLGALQLSNWSFVCFASM